MYYNGYMPPFKKLLICFSIITVPDYKICHVVFLLEVSVKKVENATTNCSVKRYFRQKPSAEYTENRSSRYAEKNNSNLTSTITNEVPRYQASILF